MRLHNDKRCRRPGFTLVELIMVILIILTLASLLLSAVYRAMNYAWEAQTRTEISQLSQAVQAFCSNYKVPYIPSRVRLYNSMTGTNSYPPPATPPPRTTYDLGINTTTKQPNNQLEYDSYQFLYRVWPRLTSGSVGGWTSLSWNCPPSVTPPTYYDLEGEECLVFFLGGMQALTSTGFQCNGFGTSPSDPTSLTSGAVTPFYTFKSERLTQRPLAIVSGGTTYAATNPFLSYIDAYGSSSGGSPYAYFSSYKAANGYSRYATLTSGSTWAALANPPVPVSDCGSILSIPFTSLAQTINAAAPPSPPSYVYPYAASVSTTPFIYQNPQTFQIVSAGKDGAFGLGTDVSGASSLMLTWTPQTAGNGPPPGYTFPAGDPTSPPFDKMFSNAGTAQYSPGYDDISNFYSKLLGVPQP